MPKLQLFIPAKPFIVTQGWGIMNASYKEAGFPFTHHNGVDFAVDDDVQVEAMCDGIVTETGYKENDAGNYVKYRTDLVNAEGDDCFVEFVYAHGSQILVTKGEKVFTGKPLILAGNTGFTTGPHTHISAYRIDIKGNRLDKDPATNFTFDWSKYLVNWYTADVWLMVKRLWSLLRVKVN